MEGPVGPLCSSLSRTEVAHSGFGYLQRAERATVCVNWVFRSFMNYDGLIDEHRVETSCANGETGAYQ